MDAEQIALLERSSQAGPVGEGRIVEVIVNACAFSCCGRGWRRRDGYEQTYRGWVDNFQLPEHEGQRGTFMLYTLGLGQISAVIAAGFDEVVDVVSVSL